ncbi:MAG: SpoIIE family protein phosphatase [Roseiflexaceae bacterium]
MSADKAYILVVDDNEHNRDMLSRRLQRQNYRVEVAEHGRQALERMRSEHFDLVLLDIMMPEMNGYQVLEHVKGDPALQFIPIIMISAIDDVDSVARCIELGAEDYLFKPFNPILLRARIEASLEKKRLRDQERAYLQALQRDLEFGRRIQAGFLPDQLPQLPGWDLAAVFYSAREVAGDFYDSFLLPDGRLVLAIADVCDKGVGAALYMALIRSLIRTHAELLAVAGDDPLHAVRQTNRYVATHHQRSGSAMFSTLFFAVLSPDQGLLRYINAGHYPALLVSAPQAMAALEPTGPAIGLAATSHYTIAEANLPPGSLLVAYTDGLIEARRGRGDFFGEDRLAALLSQPSQSAEQVLTMLQSALQVHLGDAAPDDDVTLLALRRTS